MSAGTNTGETYIVGAVLRVREQEVFSHRVPLRWRDIDAFGHVNHATYMTLFEEARDAWLDARLAMAAPYPYIIVRVTVDYRSQLILEDTPVEVRISLVHIGTKSLRMFEQLFSSNGVLGAEATVTIVLLDEELRKTRALTLEERELCERELRGANSEL